MWYLAVGIFLLFGTPLVGEEKKQNNVEEISPTEDLMREHGILNRCLLIYQEIARRIDNYEEFPIATLQETAQILKSFIEDYHEKLEENYIFPLFEKAKKELDLVKTLKEQHDAGRRITDYILKHADMKSLQNDIQKLFMADYLKLYVRMFRPHEAREDTVLFPQLKKIISKEQLEKLGDIFEDKEHALFGENGFENTVNKVGSIEKELHIYNLSQFTAY
jgi:hemerythrin-like domain-containing protein